MRVEFGARPLNQDVDRLAAGCLLAGFAGLDPPDSLLRWLERGLGGVVLFARNVRDLEQVARLTARLRAERPELVVAIDEEGGDVTRLEAATGSSYPGNLALGVVDDVTVTRAVSAAIASDLGAVGVNTNFAPVADVNTNPRNPVIGVRSFGADPALVARHTSAFVQGAQDGGVAACAKHFPGHGDTSADSHLELPVAEGDLATALIPFRAAIEAGVRAVMTAHVVIPSLGPDPATLSRRAVTELLRGELGFRGTVVCDALEMRAVAATVGVEEAAVRALAAGVDALCLGAELEPEPVHAALVAAVSAGRLTPERLSEAAGRVASTASSLTTARKPVDRSVGRSAAVRGVRWSGSVRLASDPLVVELVPEATIAAGRAAVGLGDVLRRRRPGTDVVRGGNGPPTNGRPLVVVLRDAARHPWQQEAATDLLAARRNAVVVETGVPGWLPDGAEAWILTHGAGRVNLEAAADLLG